MQNAIPSDENGVSTQRSTSTGVAARIAQESLTRRGVDYADEVRRLLDAALEVMQRCGTTSRPRVADIVAAAGLSNEAFYRHFASKDALVSALLEDGAERLQSYLAHQMAKERTPEAQVRQWVKGVLAQADGEIADTTLAVLYNAGGAGDGQASGRHFASRPLAELLHEPFGTLGSNEPALPAAFVTHAVTGTLADHLWARTTPTDAEADRMAELCLTVARADR